MSFYFKNPSVQCYIIRVAAFWRLFSIPLGPKPAWVREHWGQHCLCPTRSLGRACMQHPWQVSFQVGWQGTVCQEGGGDAERHKVCGMLLFSFPPAVCCGVAGSGAPPLHPSQLSAKRCWQRGVDKVFGGLPGSSERSQTLSHAATCPTGDADAEDPAQALCR